MICPSRRPVNERAALRILLILIQQPVLLQENTMFSSSPHIADSALEKKKSIAYTGMINALRNLK